MKKMYDFIYIFMMEKLTLENPQQEESMLYDQSLEYLDMELSDFITKHIWNKNLKPHT